jgi:hypothetical protein
MRSLTDGGLPVCQVSQVDYEPGTPEPIGGVAIVPGVPGFPGFYKIKINIAFKKVWTFQSWHTWHTWHIPYSPSGF